MRIAIACMGGIGIGGMGVVLSAAARIGQIADAAQRRLAIASDLIIAIS
jgi:hypothetical protein